DLFFCFFFCFFGGGGGGVWEKPLTGRRPDGEDIIQLSQEEIILGTKRTQFFFLFQVPFIFFAIEGIRRLIVGLEAGDPLSAHYPLLTYIGFVASFILIDNKATIKSKSVYLRKGLTEIAAIVLVLLVSGYIAQAVKQAIPLPQIFFAMLISSSLGMMLSRWQFGPTVRALLFAGIPVVLAANFMIGGSRIMEAFALTGMTSVMAFGFFGQIFWMFGGLTLLILFGLANNVRNLAPGMAGSLSHAGLTGACTAGDLGQDAAARAPIMINIPFFGHIFIFTIFALSMKQGIFMTGWAALIVLAGIILTIYSLRTLRGAQGREAVEVKGLMQFSFGWQLVAVMGSPLLLHLFGMPLTHAAMATSSSISHFGLFAALQGGMFGAEAAEMIPFIFAMPFLVHPLVFGMFGKAMAKDGVMPATVVYTLALIGVIGVIYALIIV
ncbi:MAG TPA: hypothetical protein DCQ14_01995, partial [Firmicutes bacterium]|nr:hypothetical protein [Bacillota bacterium]